MIKKGHVIWVILLLLSCSVYAQDAGQKWAQNELISYKELNASATAKVQLKEALKQLEHKFKVSFMYRSGLLDRMYVQSGTEYSDHFGEELQKLLAPLNLEYFRLNERTFVITPDLAGKYVLSPEENDQQEQVSGQITDASISETLPGVNIIVKGTTIGTATDGDGNYSLTVPSLRDTLVFSFIGYQTQEVPINGRTNIDLALQPQAVAGEEVVVVGYGTQTRADITSSVSQVSEEEIRQTPTTSLQNSLTGKLPGFFSQQRSGQPGGASAADIYIRGVSTYTGSQRPLVLVDNVEYNYGQLFMIDPNEVESISILKDAAATAIYGIKGANGVILITTRRGKIGRPTIHVRTQWGVQTPVHQLKTLNAYQTAQLRNEALINDGLPAEFTDEDLKLFKSGTDPYGHPDINWNDVLFKNNASIQKNNLDISGGTERVRYYITLGYLRQGGLLRDIPYNGNNSGAAGVSEVNNNYYHKRYKFRSNLDIKATNSLSFKLDIAGTYAETNSPQATGALDHVYEYEYLNPYMYPAYNPDGSFGYANPNRIIPRNLQNNVAGLVALGGYSRSLNDFMDVHLSGTQKLDQVIQGLSLQANVAYSFANNAHRNLTRGNFPSFWYNPEEGTYDPRDPNVYRIDNYSLSYTRATAHSPNRRLNLQGSLNYKHSFGSHNLSGLVLFNQTSYTETSDPPSKFRGYTFRLGYNFQEKYLFQISGAYNGSDRFVTQKRYQLFPAFSAGWNIAREAFFKNSLPFITTFKIRGSYGWVGSDDIGGNRYLYEDVYDRSGSYSFGESHNNVSGIIEGVQGNDDVTWETERKVDVGLDFSLFEGKISGSFDYFDNYRYNILTQRSTIPLYFGVQQTDLPPVNIGKVSNKGFEIEMVYRGRAGQVGINVKGNVSFAKNKILLMDEAPPEYPWQQATGLPIGMTKQYVWEGTFYQDQADIDTSAAPPGIVRPGFLKYQDLNGDGIINTDDMAYTGSPNLPNTNIGFTLGFSYKGLSFTTLLQAALNFDVYAGFDMAVPFKTVMQPIHLDRWTPETASTAKFPALSTNFVGTYMNPNGNPSTFWTVGGDYLRIRSMEVGYQIPVRIVNKAGLSGAKLFVNGYNLLTWSKVLKKYQFDPEVKDGSDHFVYPTERVLNFGLDLTF